MGGVNPLTLARGKPEEVYAYMDSFYRSNGVNPGRSGYDLSIETGNVVENTRKLLTNYFNGTDKNRLVFSLNLLS